MDPLNIRLSVAKTNPARLAEFVATWLTAYEAAHRSTPGDYGAPELIQQNAYNLAKVLADAADSAMAEIAGDLVHEVAKQAFAIGSGRPFPEIQIVAAPPGGKTTSSNGLRERVQVIERDPETLEISRTITR